MIHLSVALVCFPIASASLAASTQDALGEGMARYRAAEGVEARTLALEQVAALGAGPGAPDPEALCRALAEGLADELAKVRARAVALVAAAGPPAVSAEVLLAATETHVALEREIDARVRSWRPESLDGLFSTSKEERARANDELQSRSKELIGFLEQHEDVPAVRTALLNSWPFVRDDRAVTGLAALFEHAGFSAFADPAVDGLLAIGTAPALEALAGHTVRYESALELRDERERELSRMRPKKVPSELFDADRWKEGELQRIANLRAAFEREAREQDAWMKAFAKRLRAFGAAHALGTAPHAPKPGRAWMAWAAKAREVLPASVEGN